MKKNQENSSQEAEIQKDTKVEEVTIQETLSQESSVPDVESEIAEIKDQLLRALAEAENVRRRAAQDKEDALKYGVTNFARDMLSIADTLRRALEHINKETLPEDLKPFVDGIEITEKELLNLFERYTIKRIDPLGEKFDSNLHQAMFEQETEEHEAGTITQVMQSGYTIHNRLLRPAMVGVAKKKA